MLTDVTSRARDIRTQARVIAGAACAILALASLSVTGASFAQDAGRARATMLDGASKLGMVPPQQATSQPAARIAAQTGVWIEGPGYDVTHGKSYEVCAARCLQTPRCVMIEYYRPERKCNHYAEVRPRKRGGASIVGVRQLSGVAQHPSEPRLVTGPAAAVRPGRDR